MSALPELGVGAIWLTGLDQWIEASGPLVDFLEIEPATLTLPDGSTPAVGDDALQQLAADPRPVVAHGVSSPVGGTIAPDAGFHALARAADLVDSPWVSEHLSINRLQHGDGSVHPTGFFLPPAQTPDAVEVAAANLRRLRDITGRPVAFETGVNYLQPRPGEMSDGAFWRAVAEAADCFILCDLHNIWCNASNGRQPFDETIDELPLDRICEIHLAGGREHDGYLLDSHAGLAEPALMAKAAQVIERLPALSALTFEMMPNSIPLCDIDVNSYRAQFEDLQRMWERRGASAGKPMSSAPTITNSPLDSTWDTASWEEALAASFTHLSQDRHHDLTDPGIGIYRHLIYKMRGGTVVSTNQLSYRMLAMSRGLDAANQVLADYQQLTPPSLWASEEAQAFSDHLRKVASDVPYLLDVVNFEAASREVMTTGESIEVTFGCDPIPLLAALREGKRPTDLVAEPHAVMVQP